MTRIFYNTIIIAYWASSRSGEMIGEGGEAETEDESENEGDDEG